MMRHIKRFMVGAGIVFGISLMIVGMVGLFYMAFEYPIPVLILISIPVIYYIGRVAELLGNWR